MEDRINGCYTQLLRRVFNISWRDHITNKQEVYSDILPLSSVIRQRRLRFAGHCVRTEDQPVSRLIFWSPPGRKPKRGRKPLQYPDVIVNDIGLQPAEIQRLMINRPVWTQLTCDASTVPSTDDQ